MDFKSIYEQLIASAQARPIVPSSYAEVHHIKPRCMGGSDSKKNLVPLTAREHFMAHKLLARIHRGTKYEKRLCHAVVLMSGNQEVKWSRQVSYERERIMLLNRRITERRANTRRGRKEAHNAAERERRKQEKKTFKFVPGRVSIDVQPRKRGEIKAVSYPSRFKTWNAQHPKHRVKRDLCANLFRCPYCKSVSGLPSMMEHVKVCVPTGTSRNQCLEIVLPTGPWESDSVHQK